MARLFGTGESKRAQKAWDEGFHNDSPRKSRPQSDYDASKPAVQKAKKGEFQLIKFGRRSRSNAIGLAALAMTGLGTTEYADPVAIHETAPTQVVAEIGHEAVQAQEQFKEVLQAPEDMATTLLSADYTLALGAISVH